MKPGITAFNCPNCGAAIPPESPSCGYCGSALATRVCPACFGAVRIGMKHCPHCGAETAAAGPEKPGDLRCPRCEVRLILTAVGGHRLDSCSRCGGLWVRKDVFQTICTREEGREAVLRFHIDPAQPPASPVAKPRRAYIPCPECGQLMNHKNFSGCSGIVLDWCRSHGSWFDGGELQRIVLFIRSDGLQKAREREQLQLKEQEERIRMQELSMAALDRRIGASIESAQVQDPVLQLLSKFL